MLLVCIVCDKPFASVCITVLSSAVAHCGAGATVLSLCSKLGNVACAVVSSTKVLGSKNNIY